MGELETEADWTRAETAAFLRDLADQLDGDGAVGLELGARRVTFDPTDPVTVKLEGEPDWTAGDVEAKRSIEIELVWRRAARSAEEARLDVESTGA